MSDMLTSRQQDQLSKLTRSFGLIARVLGWLEVSQLKRILSKTEDIKSIIYGICGASFVLLVSTDKRLHFIDIGWFHSRIEDYQYSHIESVEYDTSLMFGMVRLQAAQGTVFLKFAPNRLIREFAKIVQSHMGQNGKDGNELEFEIIQLERLAKMHKSGDLTDKEFEDEKAKIIK